jgi:hypothetical protein
VFPSLSNIPPGLNSPYGPYGGIPSGNPANSGLAPPSGINTQNQILDLVLNTVFAGVMGDTPMLRTFGRPKVSDYSYTSMQERQRVSQMVTPDVISANPMFGSMISGDLGKNRYFQQFADSIMSPGGSMGDAFNTVYGRFTKDLAGPGLRNASTNAILAANIVKNTDKAFLDENGMYDYRKTYGFDRSETYKNADAYNRVFGGFTGSVDARDEVDRAVELGTLSQTVLEEAERRGDITPDQAQEAKEKIKFAESRLQESRNIVPTEMSSFVGNALREVGTQLGVAPADTPVTREETSQAPSVSTTSESSSVSDISTVPSASDVAAQPETETGFVDTAGLPYEPPSNFPKIAPFSGAIESSERAESLEAQPRSNELSGQQERPRTPEAPVQSEISEAPKVPVQSERPEAPEVPEAPALPERPEAPEVLVQSERPEAPEVPVQPERPEAPEVPVQPERPEAPGVPVQPERPEAPGVPVQPERPEAPEVPVQPERPEAPEVLEAPVEIERPEAPEVPEAQVLPERSEVVEAPVRLDGPEAPEVPPQAENVGTFEASTIPERPEAPEVPVQPERPEASEVLEAPVEVERPEAPEVSVQSERPEAPEVPVQPERPEAPEVLEVPVEVERPEAPEVSVQSERPEAPEVPVQPERPEAPEVPVQPERPEAPEVLEVPVEVERPEAPEVPVQPERPEAPEVSVQSERPEAPEVPVQPERPEAPEVPVQPERPEAPEVPVQPERPEAPEVLEAPVEVERPEAPGVPVQPERPEAPGVPVQPERPEAPEVLEAPVEVERPEAPEVPEVPEAPEVPEVPEAPVEVERPEATDTLSRPDRVEISRTSNQVEVVESSAPEIPVILSPEITPEEVSEEVKQKRDRFNELNKQYEEVKGFLDSNKESPEVGVNKVQSDEIERRLDQIVEEITVLDEQKGQERKSEFNSIKRQIKGDVETAVASAQDTYQDVINTYGTPQQQGLAATSLEDRSRGPIADLAEATTPENAERQEAARNKFLEVNKMTREAQNLFGQELDTGELMQSVKGLVEGASGMSTSDVTDLLQRIQATAVVVDMSNEAIVRYFDVLDNMYKGMGVRSGNRANMAQNALLAADASVQARKEVAQARGEMYTGPDTGELAQKFAEYQGKTARSPRNSRAFAYLATLSDEGAEGAIKRDLENRMAEGDIEGAMDVISGGIESGSISGDKQRLAGTLEAANNEFGTSPEQQEYIRRGLVARYGEEKANQIMGTATGEDFSVVTQAVGKQLGDLIFGAGGDDESAELINQKLGAGASDKIREALISGELSGEELKDPVAAKAKLSKMFAGASDSALEDARDQIAGGIFATPGAVELLDGVLSPEEQKIQTERTARMKEVKGEINDTIENRAEYMRDLNPVGETFSVVYDTIKKMSDAGAKDFSDPEAIIAAAGGSLKEWAGMTESERNQMAAAVETFTAGSSEGGMPQTLEGMETFKEKIGEIKDEAQKYGEEKAEIAKRSGITDAVKLEEIREKNTKSYEEKKMKELKESFTSDKKDESGGGEDSEKGAFDSDTALQNLLTAIGDVAAAIANLGSDKTARSDGNPDARVEQNFKLMS